MDLFEAMCLCIQTKKNKNTNRAMQNDLFSFAAFLKRGDAPVTALNDENVEKFKCELISGGPQGADPKAISTIIRRLTNLRTFSGWCVSRGLLDKRLEVVIPEEEELAPGGLTEEEEVILKRGGLRLITGGGNKRGSEKKKAHGALVVLLLETGLRIGAVANLKRVQVKGAMLKNVMDKGSSLRDVRLSDVAVNALGTYLETRTDNDPRLFLGCVETLRRWVEKVSRTCGKRINPHALRHTFAYGILNDTKDLRLVSQLLGHKSIKSTMRYTVRGDQDIYKVLNRQRAM
jgi:integrase/recombinase XerC